jgi:hypothetical protein
VPEKLAFVALHRVHHFLPGCVSQAWISQPR